MAKTRAEWTTDFWSDLYDGDTATFSFSENQDPDNWDVEDVVNRSYAVQVDDNQPHESPYHIDSVVEFFFWNNASLAQALRGVWGWAYLSTDQIEVERSVLEEAKRHIKKEIRRLDEGGILTRIPEINAGDFVDFASNVAGEWFGRTVEGASSPVARAFICLTRAAVSYEPIGHLRGALVWLNEITNELDELEDE